MSSIYGRVIGVSGSDLPTSPTLTAVARGPCRRPSRRRLICAVVDVVTPSDEEVEHTSCLTKMSASEILTSCPGSLRITNLFVVYVPRPPQSPFRLYNCTCTCSPWGPQCILSLQIYSYTPADSRTLLRVFPCTRDL